MSKIRVIVTGKYPDGSFDPSVDTLKRVELEDLIGYDEITISGGEVMQFSPQASEMVFRLRQKGFAGKVYLETSVYNRKRWGDVRLAKDVDGVVFTLHYPLHPRCIHMLENLQSALKEFPYQKRHDVLMIDKRASKDERVRKAIENAETIWHEVHMDKECQEKVIFGDTDVFYDLENV